MDQLEVSRCHRQTDTICNLGMCVCVSVYLSVCLSVECPKLSAVCSNILWTSV